jgi:hypothetical protein
VHQLKTAVLFLHASSVNGINFWGFLCGFFCKD